VSKFIYNKRTYIYIYNINYTCFRFMVPCLALQYVQIHPTRCNYIILAFISRTLHVSGIHHAHHQEHITASAVVGITYEHWTLHFMIRTLICYTDCRCSNVLLMVGMVNAQNL
jgi:hypothetical protein